MGSNEYYTNLDGINSTIIIIAAIVIVIFFVIGLIKKTMWMWGVALVLLVAIGLTQPAQVEHVTDAIVEFFGGGTNPLSDYDYSSEAEELDKELIN